MGSQMLESEWMRNRKLRQEWHSGTESRLEIYARGFPHWEQGLRDRYRVIAIVGGRHSRLMKR